MQGYRDLAALFFNPSSTVTSLRVRVLAHAQHLNPNDMTLNFELMNARLKELEAHVKDHQKGAADDQHIRLLRTRALNESRRLLSTPDGLYSSTLHALRGQLFHQLRHFDESVDSYSRALMLKIGAWFGLGASGNPWKSLLRDGYLSARDGASASMPPPPRLLRASRRCRIRWRPPTALSFWTSFMASTAPSRTGDRLQLGRMAAAPVGGRRAHVEAQEAATARAAAGRR